MSSYWPKYPCGLFGDRTRLFACSLLGKRRSRFTDRVVDQSRIHPTRDMQQEGVSPRCGVLQSQTHLTPRSQPFLAFTMLHTLPFSAPGHAMLHPRKPSRVNQPKVIASLALWPGIMEGGQWRKSAPGSFRGLHNASRVIDARFVG